MKETREKIIQQALAYFSVHDYERASLNDIAGALGVTKGAIYHYFGSKDDLFREAVLCALDDMSRIFARMTDGAGDRTFKERLSLWFDFSTIINETKEKTGMDLAANYANTIYLMFAAMKKFPQVGAAMNEIYSDFIKSLTAMLEKARDAGEIRADLDLPAMAFEMTAFTEGTMLVGSVLARVDLAELGPRIFDNFWLRLQAGPGED